VTQASSTPIVWLKSYLVHTQALPTGDYVTPSAIAMAYALAAPLQLAWTMNIIQTRTKSIRAGFFPWIIVAMYSVAMARAAYIPTDDPQKAIESYSTNSQIVMSSDVIFSLLFCSANIGSSAVLIVALRQLSTPFRRTRRSRRKEK
jgi:hypothetical protein